MTDFSTGADLEWACKPFITVDEFFEAGCDCSVTGDDEELIERAINAASDRLAMLSGGVIVGACEQTIIVCRDGCACSCRTSCRCGLDFIQIPGPIISVESITFDGYEVFEANDFRLIDDDKIAFVDGSDYSWPCSADITIVYTVGVEPDQFVKDCAMELACYVVKAATSGKPQVGPNIGSVQRQGYTLQRKQVSFFADLTQMAATDRPWMAEFLAIYNPDRARVPTAMTSADMPSIHVVNPLP